MLLLDGHRKRMVYTSASCFQLPARLGGNRGLRGGSLGNKPVAQLSPSAVELRDAGSWKLVYSRSAIFAQLSLSVTVRLKTSAPGVESGSTQK